MARLNPTALRLIKQDWTDRVPAPAHDALTPAERRRFIDANPYSYLAITRSPEDLPPGVIWDRDDAIEYSRNRLNDLIQVGAFSPLASPAFYLYELRYGDHGQIGIIAGVSTREYDQGDIRIHERIREDRAEHLRAQQGGLGVQSSPIALAYRPSPLVEAAIATVVDTEDPLIDFEVPDGVRQRVWAVGDGAIGRQIQDAMASERLYLIDGHHRTAATSKLRQQFPDSDAEWILAALFSAADLRTEAFHRILPAIDGEALVVALGRRLAVRPAADIDEVLARGRNEVALLVPRTTGNGRWYLVTLPEPTASGSDADRFLATLEPIRLEREVLRPLLDLDSRPDSERITFRHGLGDRADLLALEAEAVDPTWVMRPITIETVLAASDLEAVMPPKSTYFRPKVRSGVFLRPLNDIR